MAVLPTSSGSPHAGGQFPRHLYLNKLQLLVLLEDALSPSVTSDARQETPSKLERGGKDAMQLLTPRSGTSLDIDRIPDTHQLNCSQSQKIMLVMFVIQNPLSTTQQVGLFQAGWI